MKKKINCTFLNKLSFRALFGNLDMWNVYPGREATSFPGSLSPLPQEREKRRGVIIRKNFTFNQLHSALCLEVIWCVHTQYNMVKC